MTALVADTSRKNVNLMGYDLHIVRTDNWIDADKDPINKADIDDLVSQDPELAGSTDNYVVMNRNGKSIKYYAILWKGDPVFLWLDTQVTCKNPDKSHISKMISMATALNGAVIGDDGERYEDNG